MSIISCGDKIPIKSLAGADKVLFHQQAKTLHSIELRKKCDENHYGLTISTNAPLQ